MEASACREGPHEGLRGQILRQSDIADAVAQIGADGAVMGIEDDAEGARIIHGARQGGARIAVLRRHGGCNAARRKEFPARVLSGDSCYESS